MRWTGDDFTLDSESFEIQRDGQRVATEPRVLELLIYLIENQSRVVSKDELFEQVWKAQQVADSALTRCIHQARRAVGSKELIKTVYGRGYQWVGEVRSETLETVVPGTEAPTTQVPKTEAPDTGTPDAEVPDTGTPEATTPHEPASHTERKKTPRAAGRWAVALLVIAMAFGIAFARHWSPASEGTAGSKHPAADATSENDDDPQRLEHLAILPIRALEGMGAELTASSLSDQIWIRLSTHPGLVVRSPEHVRKLLAEQLPEASPGDLIEAAGVDAVITGQLRATVLSDRWQLTVKMWERAVDGRNVALPVGEYEIREPSSEEALQSFLRSREAVANDVVQQLAPTFAGAAANGITPRNPQALRLYLEARELFATITCGDAAALLEILDRALEADPEYALAWVAKGYALYSQTWSCGRDASFAQAALEAARRGRELAPAYAEGLFLEARLLVEGGQAEEAMALLEEAEQTLGPTPSMHFARSYVLRYAGFLEASERQLELTLAKDPIFLREFSDAPVTLLYLGQIERFLDLLPVSETPHDRYYRGLALTLDDQRQAAVETLSPAFELNPNGLFGRLAASLAAVLEGESEAGLEMIRAVVRQRRQLATPDGEMTFKEAQLLAWAGDSEGALLRLDEAVDQGFFCAPCIESEPRLAALAEDPRLASILARARTRHEAFAQRFGLEPAS